jgi:hypothetical protein
LRSGFAAIAHYFAAVAQWICSDNAVKLQRLRSDSAEFAAIAQR